VNIASFFHLLEMKNSPKKKDTNEEKSTDSSELLPLPSGTPFVEHETQKVKVILCHFQPPYHMSLFMIMAHFMVNQHFPCYHLRWCSKEIDFDSVSLAPPWLCLY